MQTNRRGARTAGIIAGATVLTAGGAGTAYAHQPTHAAKPIPQAMASDTRLAIAKHANLATLQARLDHLTTWVAKLRARVDGVSADAVLAPKQRVGAVKGLTFATGLDAHLAALPTTGDFALTAAQQDQVAALRASLAHIAGHIRAILDNGTRAKPTETAVKSAGATLNVAKFAKVRPRVLSDRRGKFRGWSFRDGDHDGNRDRVFGRADRRRGHHCDGDKDT